MQLWELISSVNLELIIEKVHFFLSPRIVIWSWEGPVFITDLDLQKCLFKLCWLYCKKRKYERHLIQVDPQSYHDSKMTSFCTLLRGYWKGQRHDQYTFLKRFKHPGEKVPEVEWRLFGMFCLLHSEHELVPCIAHLPPGLLLNASLQTYFTFTDFTNFPEVSPFNIS